MFFSDTQNPQQPEPDPEGEHAQVHAFYVDSRGADQRVTVSFTVNPTDLGPHLPELQHCLARLISSLGGTLLAMQLEIGTDAPLLESKAPAKPDRPATILPWKPRDVLTWAAVGVAACTALSLDRFGAVLAVDKSAAQVRLYALMDQESDGPARVRRQS